jgi:DNA-binding beta-propeller fold protein YncE
MKAMRDRAIYLIAAMVTLIYLFYPSALKGQEYEFVLSWPEEILGLKYPTGVAVDGSGNIYVADVGNDRIQKFDSEGNSLTKWGTAGTGDGQFSRPRGLAVDAAGNVYVTDHKPSDVINNGHYHGRKCSSYIP